MFVQRIHIKLSLKITIQNTYIYCMSTLMYNYIFQFLLLKVKRHPNTILQNKPIYLLIINFFFLLFQKTFFHKLYIEIC